MGNKIPNYLLNTMKCIYRNTKIRIKFNGGISEPIHINKGVRQGCGLSPVLFNIYINKIIQEFKTVIKKGIQPNNRKLVNTRPPLWSSGQRFWLQRSRVRSPTLPDFLRSRSIEELLE